MIQRDRQEEKYEGDSTRQRLLGYQDEAIALEKTIVA